MVLQHVKKLLDEGHSVGAVAALGRERLLGSDPGEANFAERKSVLALAPTNLTVHRASRYQGEGLGISLRELEPQELATVCRLYELTKRAYELWRYMDDTARDESLVLKRLEAILDPELLADIARLGSLRQDRPPLVRAALEDARWGAMGPLVRQLEAISSSSSREQLAGAVMLSRDQAKMLRNAFEDIDPILREADERAKAHGIRGMASKLDMLDGHLKTVLDWQGSVSSRCLETSTVDRVLYDFLRRIHALRAPSVRLWVIAINDELTRWAFHIGQPGFAPHQADQLASLAVGHAMGLSPAAALAQGYLGTKDGWAWFHWPIFEPGPGVPICDCDIHD